MMNRLTVGVFMLGAAILGAEQPAPQTVPRFRSGVDLIVLDVSVLDRERLPVRGLTAADFTVLEDGREQRVETFLAVDLPDIIIEQEARWLRDVAPDVQRNDNLADRRIVVIVLDDAVPRDLGDLTRGREIARRVVESLEPNDLAAVVFSSRKGAGQEFTQDRGRLLAAIDRFRIAFAPTSKGGAGAFDVLDQSPTGYLASIRALRSVAESLAELPNRRKTLVWVSTGVPLDWSEALGREISQTDPGAAPRSGDVLELIHALKDMLRSVQRANTNVYAFDPGGLRAPGQVRITPKGEIIGLNPGKLNRDFLRTVSENTGGFAVVDTNDAGPGITQVFRENRSYYLLGYPASNPRADGRFRTIVVRVNRPGATVRTRSGYFEADARTQAKPARTRDPLDLAMAGMLPNSDLTLHLAAAPFAVSGRPNAGVAVIVGVRTEAPERATRVVQEIDLRAAAYGADGRQRASRRERVAATFNLPGLGGMVGYEVLTRLDLPPGRYRLRVAAERSLHGIRFSPLAPEVALIRPGQDTSPRSGSVDCDLDVPDFAGAAVSLSGVILSVVPPVVSGPKDRLASLVPVVPTTMRVFERDDEVRAFLRVYQGGQVGPVAVALAARLVDSRNATVFAHTETLAPDRFGAARAADWTLDLPVARLGSGPYLLTVEAARGTDSVRRDIRFEIR